MNYKKLRIGTDCDGCIDDFWNPYLKRFGNPKSDKEITKNVQRKLQYDKEFWTTLPVLHRVNFDITLYCTKRTSSKAYLKQWIEENNFPIAPIYQVLYQKGNKAAIGALVGGVMKLSKGKANPRAISQILAKLLG
jgi:hypothetical protein